MSAKPLNAIKGRQQAIVKDLEADGFFSNVPVIDQNKGDVESDVATAIAKMGMAVIVEVKDLEINPEGLGDASMDVIITVEETVLISRVPEGSGKECTDVVQAIICRFHPFLRGADGPTPVLLGKARVISDTGGKLVYQILGKSNIRFVKQ